MLENCANSILILGCKLLVLQLCVTAIAFDCRESKQQEFFCVKNLSRRDLVRKTSLELVSCYISRLPLNTQTQLGSLTRVGPRVLRKFHWH